MSGRRELHSRFPLPESGVIAARPRPVIMSPNIFSLSFRPFLFQ